MSPDLISRPLADLEEESLVEVEREMERRARGPKPWTTTEYLDRIDAVHTRYANFRRWQERRVAP